MSVWKNRWRKICLLHKTRLLFPLREQVGLRPFFDACVNVFLVKCCLVSNLAWSSIKASVSVGCTSHATRFRRNTHRMRSKPFEIVDDWIRQRRTYKNTVWVMIGWKFYVNLLSYAILGKKNLNFCIWHIIFYGN